MLTWSSPSALALIAANLVPLFGVLSWGWRVDDVLLLFWFESAVVGLFNVGKLLVIGGWTAVPVCGFFAVHYGGFMAGHLVFILSFLPGSEAAFFPDSDWLWQTLAVFWPAVLAMLGSHGFSFIDNFLRRQEYRGRTIARQMMDPYARIMVMHASVLFGGFMVAGTGQALPALVLLVVLKAAVDLRFHLRAHRPQSGAGGPGTGA